ncbi:MAG: hypothetical protein WCD18_05730 [Thermosynechococcaceae cyanobacterium]
MSKLDIYEILAVLIVGIQLLSQANRDMTLDKWLTPFRLGWLLSGLTMLLPQAQKGCWLAGAIAYFLVGGLIFNTLVLFICSKLPNRIVGLESPIIEMMGTVFLGMIGTGLFLTFQYILAAFKRWFNDGLRHFEGRSIQPSAA